MTFDAAKPADVYPKLNQMILGLLAKAGGTEVRIVVAERHGEAGIAKEAEPVTARVSEEEAEERSIVHLWMEMQQAGSRHHYGAMQIAWTEGKGLISQGDKWINELAWDCAYYECRFEAGGADGLETLRLLRQHNSERAEPRLAIARCLETSREFDEAAGFFIEASLLQEGEEKAQSLVNAAKAFKEIKKYVEAQTGDQRGPVNRHRRASG